MIADAKLSLVSHSLKDNNMSLYVFVCVCLRNRERGTIIMQLLLLLSVGH